MSCLATVQDVDSSNITWWKEDSNSSLTQVLKMDGINVTEMAMGDEIISNLSIGVVDTTNPGVYQCVIDTIFGSFNTSILLTLKCKSE